jgi:hypothetical protein
MGHGRERVLEKGDVHMERLKNTGLVFCLFVVLLVIFASYFRANEVGTFFGALAGTPLLVHVFNRVAPSRNKPASDTTTAALIAHAEPMPRPTEQVVVLRMEGRRPDADEGRR